MGYTAAIFDLDETLVYTSPDYRHGVVEKTINEMGGKFNEQNSDRFWFEQDRDTTIREQFKLDPKIFWEKFRMNDIAEKRASETKAYEDSKIVKELHQSGIKIGIVTGAPSRIAKLELALIGNDYFDSVVTANLAEGIPEKPDPTGLLLCMEKLRVSPNETVYTGNSLEDVNVANNAAVTPRFIQRNGLNFPGINPSITMHSLYELRNLF